MVEKNFAKGYSKGNKDKYDNVRLENSSINKIVITYSVCDGDLSKTLSTLHRNGASVHYLIDQNGVQYQEHNDYLKTFFAASGKFKDESTNETGVSIMLINDANSEFTQEQITKLIDLIQELQTKHGITDVLGLSEVYYRWNNADKKHVFMEAPGSLFPWKALSDAGVVRSIKIPEEISNECIDSPTSEQISALQASMKNFGYNLLAVNGEFDEFTQHFTKVINNKYAYLSSECISDQTLYIANSLSGIDIIVNEL